MNNAKLIVIDAQNDFMDLDSAALSIPGARDDMNRLARFIFQAGAHIDTVLVSLDSHSRFDIAHAVYWQDAEGAHPAPFTRITEADLAQGRWIPINPGDRAWAKCYLKALSKAKGLELTIWPEHCLVGTWGHALQADIADALETWSARTKRAPYYVFKGTQPHTEHYSMFRAEVPVPGDPSTELNRAALDQLGKKGEIFVAGEALSHCVAQSVRDLVKEVDPRRVVLLGDCMSSVPGFEAQGEAFLSEMLAMGVKAVPDARSFF